MAPLAERVQPPVEQWLRGFYDAEFVVTDSFHACVFSILFHKPFIVVGNARRGMSRFKSLLSIFALGDRLVMDVTQFFHCSVIDWEQVDSLLAYERKRTCQFFDKILIKA